MIAPTALPCRGPITGSSGYSVRSTMPDSSVSTSNALRLSSSRISAVRASATVPDPPTAPSLPRPGSFTRAVAQRLARPDS